MWRVREREDSKLISMFPIWTIVQWQQQTANERNREVREEGQVGEQRMCSVLDLTLSECELFG